MKTNVKANTVKLKPIIVIPKKNVKLANKRNKIRRQIRSILQKIKISNDKKLIIKYLDSDIEPNFQVLKNTVLAKLNCISFN